MVKCEPAKSKALNWLKDHELHVKVLTPIRGTTFIVIDFMMLLKFVCTEKCKCKTFGACQIQLLKLRCLVLGSKATYVTDNYHLDQSIKAAAKSRSNAVEI